MSTSPASASRVGLGSAYDLYPDAHAQERHHHARQGRRRTGLDRSVLCGEADAAAGVRQPLEAHAKTDPNVRVMKEPFMAIQQAMGVPPGRPAAARYVRDFVEEMKKNGFVAAALKRSGQSPDLVAPPAAN